MKWFRPPVRLLHSESGIAAIEMALIAPLLLLLFLGMVDVSTMLADNRRISYAAAAVGNVVVRFESPTTKDKIADAFRAAELVMRSGQMDPMRVEIYNYRKVGTTVSQVWSRNNGTGNACTAPATPDSTSLMAAGNDIIITVACSTYRPFIGRILGYNYLGSNITMREQIATRPRFSLLLDCSDCST